jgi:hypothetical protein
MPADITTAMDQLFGLGGPSWQFWHVVVKVLFCLDLTDDEITLALRHTGRTKLFSSPLRELWLWIGRRGGKSRIIAMLAVFLATFGSYPMLAPGEMGTILLTSPTAKQSRALLLYVLGFLHSVPMLARMIVRETDDSVELTHNVIIECRAPVPGNIRGSTVIAGLVDECAYLPQETSANPDSELLAALRPSMSTIPDSILICSSTPHEANSLGPTGSILAMTIRLWHFSTRRASSPIPV